MIKQKSKLAGSFFIVILAILILLGLWRFQLAQVDDAYITYRYARHLANGLGFAYNPPTPDFGTTTPLYTLMLTLAAILGMDIPTASLIFCGVSLFSITILFYIYMQGRGSGLGIYLPASLVVLLPGSVLVFGMETILYTALVYYSLYLVSQKRYLLGMTVASLATLTRYDGLIAAAIVFFYEMYETNKFPLKSGVLFSGLISLWLVYATLIFGSPLPNSFLAKTGEFSGNVFVNEFANNLAILIGFFSAGASLSWLILIVLGGVLLFIGYWIKDTFPRLIILWCVTYLIAFILLGIRYAFHWYYYPLLPGLVLVLVLGLIALKETKKISWLGIQLLNVLFLVPLTVTIILGEIHLLQQADTAPALGTRNKVYTLAAEWICLHSSEQTTIAIPEIGLVGWHCDRKIIDPYGLVNPEMISYILNGDSLGGVIALRPDMIAITNVLKDGQPFTIPESERFVDEYTVAHVIEYENYPYYFVIFEKKR